MIFRSVERRRRQRTISIELDESMSGSGDSDDFLPSPKQSTINIMNNIRKKLMSKYRNRNVNFEIKLSTHKGRFSVVMVMISDIRPLLQLISSIN